MNGNKPDMEKRLYWRRILEEAATSGISMREFCRQRRLKETQFYWWRRMLKSGGQERRGERPVERERGSVALGRGEVGAMTAAVGAARGGGGGELGVGRRGSRSDDG